VAGNSQTTNLHRMAPIRRVLEKPHLSNQVANHAPRRTENYSPISNACNDAGPASLMPVKATTTLGINRLADCTVVPFSRRGLAVHESRNEKS
jgi:hypothetical protein